LIVTPSPGLAKALGQIGVAVRPTFLSSKDAARVNDRQLKSVMQAASSASPWPS
jgi:hypothetical protein